MVALSPLRAETPNPPPGREPVVIVPLSGYTSLKETDYLLRSPANREALLDSIADLDTL